MKSKFFIIPTALLLMISCKNSLSEKEIETFTNQGNQIAQETTKKLGGTLVKKMKEGGITEAVPFCNTAAIPLTKEMSEKYQVSIKRTSNKIRNQVNLPNEEETKILNNYHSLFAQNKTLSPIVELDHSGKPHYYAPIILQKKCLACHGTLEKEVSKKTDSLIKSYYPKDLATGFKENDLRGIWSITFNQ